ncbi:hypothetical protein OROHE_010618 [Orobanche hederae]
MNHKNLMKKMITQLLLSVSIFSLVFSYSSSLFSSPLVIYPHILSRMVNKNYVFLIFNTLLFFVAKTSGLDLSGFNLYNDMPHRVLDDDADDDAMAIESELALLEKSIVFDESREKENNEDTSGKTKEISIFIAETDEDDEIRDNESEASKMCCLFEEEEKDYDDETQILGTEELNLKIEDFIRRMKAEIRVSEAR